MVFQGLSDLVTFVTEATNAQNKSEIKKAGRALADALGILGIALLMKLLFHEGGKAEPSESPTDGVKLEPGKPPEIGDSSPQGTTPSNGETGKEPENVKEDTAGTKTEGENLGTEDGKKVLAEEPIPGGHKVKVTEDGECLICSDCTTIRQEYKSVLEDPDPAIQEKLEELKAELDAADAMSADTPEQAQAKAKAEAEIRQKLEAARAAKQGGTPEPKGEPTEPAGGSIDESEKKFSTQEKRIAELLEQEGKFVKAKKEVDGQRKGDSEVDGVTTEFKTLDPGATDGTVKNVINSSIKRGGQARHIIIDSRGSGLTEADAMRGLARAKNITRGKIDSVRIIGDGFDKSSTDFN